MNLSSVPSLNWVRAFEVAARTGSFAGAGRILRISATAVSKQVRSLERHLGIDLFARGPKTVELTPNGHIFLQSVQEALYKIEASAEAAMQRTSASAGPLTIALPHLFICSWLSSRLERFIELHPEVRLILRSEATAGVVGERPDLTIRFGASPGENTDFDPLFGERLYPVARPETAVRVRTLEDLTDCQLIGIGAHRTGWIEFLAMSSVKLRQAHDITIVDTTVVALVLADVGNYVALARAPATDAMVARLGLVRCGPDVDLPTRDAYYLVYPSVKALNPRAKAFRRWLLSEVTDLTKHSRTGHNAGLMTTEYAR